MILPSVRESYRQLAFEKMHALLWANKTKQNKKKPFRPLPEPNFLSFLLPRYRRIVSNNCTDGLREKYKARMEKCPGKAPRGLHILTSDGKLVTEQGHNATFIILMEEVRFQTQQVFCSMALFPSSVRQLRGKEQSGKVAKC